MKTYYSIVSIATNAQLDEKFNMGLICVTPQNVFFHFSTSKFKLISKLLPKMAAELALSSLKGIDSQINNQETKTNSLFVKNDEIPTVVSESYLSYLNRYNNNLVQFSKAQAIDLDIDADVFKALFKKYIFAEERFETVIKPEKNVFTAVRNKFKKSAAQYTNINFNVTKDIVKDLIVPVNVEAFGKNGSYFASQSLDFGKSTKQLQSDISSYIYLLDKVRSADSNAKSFALGDEPNKSDKANHALWKIIQDTKFVEFVPLNESDRIIEEMKQRGVEPITK